MCLSHSVLYFLSLSSLCTADRTLRFASSLVRSSAAIWPGCVSKQADEMLSKGRHIPHVSLIDPHCRLSTSNLLAPLADKGQMALHAGAGRVEVGERAMLALKLQPRLCAVRGCQKMLVCSVK